MVSLCSKSLGATEGSAEEDKQTSMLLAELEADNCLETKQQVMLEKLMKFFPSGQVELKYQGYKKLASATYPFVDLEDNAHSCSAHKKIDVMISRQYLHPPASNKLVSTEQNVRCLNLL